MIRTSRHILKYQTNHKTSILDQIYDDYRSCLQFYIHLIIVEQLPLKKYLSTKSLPEYSNIVKSHWKAICYKQASEIVRSNIKYQSDKRYKRYKKVYTYFKRHNRQQLFLNKRFSELNLKSLISYIKIDIKEVSINLDHYIFDIEESNNHFDEFVKLYTPYIDTSHPYKRIMYRTIKIPLNYHKHSNKFKKWNRKSTIQLKRINGNFYINLFYEKEQPEIKELGNALGLDCGYKKLIATSDNQIIGQELEKLYLSISKKQQGSKNFKQSLIERDKLINQYCNELNLKNINHLVVEDLKNVKHKSSGKIHKKFNNKLQRWSYTKVLSKLERRCEENGIQFTKVDPAYTSQTCSSCGVVDKTNRNGETYLCKTCGTIEDADINAAINILHRGARQYCRYNPSAEETVNLY